MTAIRWERTGGPWWLAGLFLAGVASRWLTRTQLVQAWDAGNFVLALTDFDLMRHQPHLPGVFWLLILLGRALLPFTGGDGVQALEWVNILSSAIALPLGWILADRIGGSRAAAWMTVLLFSAPVLWFYAGQPLSYGAELGWVVAIACCSWGVAEGNRSSLLPLVVLMATAGGIRPNTPIFMLPLVAVCCWRGWRQGLAAWRFLAGVALGLGLLTLWFGAFLREVGGAAEFTRLFLLWKGVHTQQGSGLGFLENAWDLIRTVALTAPAGVAVALLRCRPKRPEAHAPAGSLRGWTGIFLLLWILPSAVYLIFVHFTRMGHATTLLPAVLLLLALHLAATEPRRGRGRWPRMLVAVLLLQSLLFLFVPGNRFAQNLRSYDREWGMAIAAARRHDPATTLVVTTGRSNLRAFRLPSVHLPAFDHGEADLVLDQLKPVIEVRPPLQRVLYLDRGLVMQAPELPGVRQETLIPGRLQLVEVPVPPQGLAVSRRHAVPLPGAAPPG